MVERIYAPGETIGPYLISGLLGHGGGGSVYQATHEISNAVHAVKVSRYNLREVSASEREEATRRLEREFSTLKLFPHKYLVPVYSFGVASEEATPYIGMELLIGKDLDCFLRENRGGLRVRIELFRKLVEAVAHLHAKGLVHRDLKPSNIWVRTNGDPVLLDFGLISAPWMPTITNDGKVLGTPQFMSPESFKHSGPDHYQPKPTDDVYALGVLFYLMLTGALPHTTPAHGLFRRKPIEHPSDRAPHVPYTLGDFALRMLLKEPARRPQNAQAVLAELAHLARATPFGPSPELATETIDAFPRRVRRRLPVVLGASCVVAAAVLALVLTRAKPSPEAPSPPAPAERCDSPIPPWAMSITSSRPQAPAALVPSATPVHEQARSTVPLRPTSRAWLATICALTGVGHLACASVPVRSDEDFLDQCSPKARATTERLDLSINKDYLADLQDWPGKERRNETPLFIRNGPVVSLVDARGKAFARERSALEGARLFGQARLEPDKDRVSIQYHRLQLKTGEELPICAVAYDVDGFKKEPGITRFPEPGQATVPSDAEALHDLRKNEMPISWRSHFFKVR